MEWFRIRIRLVAQVSALVVLCSGVVIGLDEMAWSQAVPPVDAPVVDGYRPPAHIGGPGNRGWEYHVSPAAPVRAARAGTVAFAGNIGGRLYVSINHAGWVRTTYSYLQSIHVVAGQPIAAGDVLGTASGSFHFGARRSGEYIDPASLFGATTVRPVLIPRI